MASFASIGKRKKLKVSSTPMHWIVYSRDILGYVMAATVQHWCEENKQRYTLFPSYITTNDDGATHVPSAEYGQEENLNDTFWFLGVTPPKYFFQRMSYDRRYDNIRWFDWHTEAFPKADDIHFEAQLPTEGVEIQYTTPDYRQPMVLWETLFSTEVPKVIKWIVDAHTGKGTISAKAFYKGLSLVDCDPKSLMELPQATEDDYSDAKNYWTMCFGQKDPYRFGQFQQQDDDSLVQRMTWDVVFQTMNMGGAIQNYIVSRTQDALENGEFTIASYTADVDALDYNCMYLLQSWDVDYDTIVENAQRSASTIYWAGGFKYDRDGFLKLKLVHVPNTDLTAEQAVDRILEQEGFSNLRYSKQEGWLEANLEEVLMSCPPQHIGKKMGLLDVEVDNNENRVTIIGD